MSVWQNLEYILLNETQKLQDLESATDIIRSKNFIQDELLSAHSEVNYVSQDIQILKKELKLIRNKNNYCKELLKILKALDNQIQHMDEHIPSKIKDFMNFKISQKERHLQKTANFDTLAKISECKTNVMNNRTIISMKNCEKVMFEEPDIPQIEPITEVEFLKIPKYIISRNTLDTLNGLVSSINQTIRNKYLIMLANKSSRKKVELEIFLQYNEEQASLGPEEKKTYCFTAIDYEKTVKTKLDKRKLNLIIALRHCKRLREIRTSKTVYYALIIPT